MITPSGTPARRFVLAEVLRKSCRRAFGHPAASRILIHFRSKVLRLGKMLVASDPGCSVVRRYRSNGLVFAFTAGLAVDWRDLVPRIARVCRIRPRRGCGSFVRKRLRFTVGGLRRIGIRTKPCEEKKEAEGGEHQDVRLLMRKLSEPKSLRLRMGRRWSGRNRGRRSEFVALRTESAGIQRCTASVAIRPGRS